MLWVDKTYPALDLDSWLEVMCTLVKTHTHTHTHPFSCLCCSESVAVEVERRSSVPPNHNASFHLSGSLGTYSNKWWLTHTHTHTLWLWLIRESWLGLLWSYTRQSHNSYSEQSKLFHIHQDFSSREHYLVKNKKRQMERGVEQISASWYRCTTPV